MVHIVPPHCSREHRKPSILKKSISPDLGGLGDIETKYKKRGHIISAISSKELLAYT